MFHLVFSNDLFRVLGETVDNGGQDGGLDRIPSLRRGWVCSPGSAELVNGC